MRPQLDLPYASALFALGAVGLGGTCTAAASAAPREKLAISLSAGRSVLVGRRLTISGLLDARADRRVALEEHSRRGWATVARGSVSRSGRFHVGFAPPRTGTLALRVLVSGDRSSPPQLSGTRVVTVYRKAYASWYGPGGPLACGGTLTASRLGVAHRTLPCGTLVRLHLGHRTVRVPVIDRGPYIAGRDYDLTPATKRALGFGDTGVVWATR